MHTVSEAAPRSVLARTAQQAAARMGLGFEFIDGEGYLFSVSDGRKAAVLGTGNCSPYALNPASGYSLARDKYYTYQVLRRDGTPTIDSRLFFLTERYAGQRAPGRERADLERFGADAAYPIFCKPNIGARGEYARIIRSPGELSAWSEAAARHYEQAIVQPMINGHEHRVMVLKDEALFAYRKLPARLTGNGVSTVADLLARGSVTALAADLRHASGRAARLDEIPATGEEIEILGPANRAAGGGLEGFTTTPHPALAALALRATGALGLRVAGVDLFDRSPARDLSDLVVIEVNGSPNIETLVMLERNDLIDILWRAVFEAALGDV